MRLLVLDPSTYYIGYALLKTPTGGPADEVFLSTYGLIKASRRFPPPARTRIMGAGFVRLLATLQPFTLAYEDLEFHCSTAGISAARKGKLLMVAKLIGYFNCLWDSYALKMLKLKGELLSCEEPLEIPPHMWKGNLPKTIVRTRVNVDFKLDLKSGTDEHVADAIGLGTFLVKSKGLKIKSDAGVKDRRMDISPEKKSSVQIVKA